MDRTWKYRMGHVIFWIATILFHMYTRASLVREAGLAPFLLEIVIRNILLALLIYGNLLVLLPMLIRQQRWLLYMGALSTALLVYALLKDIHDVYLLRYVAHYTSQRGALYHTFYNLSIGLFYTAFSVALELSSEWYEQRETIRRIEIERLNTELDYLKAQMNPHFLFNSLNTIYFQIDKQNQSARDMLSAFSDMLRYQLYECSVGQISIDKEVAYLRNYVGLQRMRKNDHCGVTITTGPDLSGFTIAPLLLIPFVENAFKHVSHHAPHNQIRISLVRNDDHILFNVFNTRDESPQEASSTGIGLRNVRRRLELVYNGSHKLDISECPESFDVRLSLKINLQPL